MLLIHIDLIGGRLEDNGQRHLVGGDLDHLWLALLRLLKADRYHLDGLLRVHRRLYRSAGRVLGALGAARWKLAHGVEEAVAVEEGADARRVVAAAAIRGCLLLTAAAAKTAAGAVSDWVEDVRTFS